MAVIKFKATTLFPITYKDIVIRGNKLVPLGDPITFMKESEAPLSELSEVQKQEWYKMSIMFNGERIGPTIIIDNDYRFPQPMF